MLLSLTGGRGTAEQSKAIQEPEPSTSTAGGLQGGPESLLWLLGVSQGPWGSPAWFLSNARSKVFSLRDCGVDKTDVRNLT